MFALTTRPSAVSVASLRDPFGVMDGLFSDWLAARPAPSLVAGARIEVIERGESYEVRAELPGATKDDIEVEVAGSRVSISAQANSQFEKKDGERLHYSERGSESYARSFDLPQSVDEADTVARFDNGVLILTLPKKAMAPSKRVQVR